MNIFNLLVKFFSLEIIEIKNFVIWVDNVPVMPGFIFSQGWFIFFVNFLRLHFCWIRKKTARMNVFIFLMFLNGHCGVLAVFQIAEIKN